MFVGDSIVRKTDGVLNKGDNMVICFPGPKIEDEKNHGSWQGRIYFSTQGPITQRGRYNCHS